MAGSITEVTDTNFQAEVIESATPVLVDFWAPWCGPCRVVAPVLEEINAKRDDLRVVKLNVDDNQQTAASFGIMAIPTMVLFRNGLVLALHALACVAGFMAGSSMPLVARDHSGLWRKIHEKAGPVAITFVGAATLFSLATQAYTLGGQASTLAMMGHMSPFLLLVGMLPHALPELFALFLPLAAWTLASRKGRWEDLLAATFVTVAIAIPLLIAAAALETWVSPRLLLWMGP